MVAPAIRKRARDDERRQRTAKRPKVVKRQREYHSSSEEEDGEEPTFQPVNLADEDDDDAVETNIAQATLNALNNAGEGPSDDSDQDAQTGAASDADDASTDDDVAERNGEDEGEQDDDDTQSDTSTQVERRRKKRNDPDAFATSISKILGSKLSTAKRADPVLSRSKAATEVEAVRTESKLEERARRKLRDDKKKASERGRIRDVLGGEEEGLTAEEVGKREKRLRKTAQRGVVKLFNAFAAAHRKAEEVSAETRRDGVVGIDQRREKVQALSKEAFLDLVVSGGKKVAA